MKRIILWITLGLFLSGCLVQSRAAPIPRGPFYGHFDVDRWGHKLFHKGAYQYFVSDALAAQLEPFRGMALRINVTHVDQGPTTETGVILTKVDKVDAVSSADGLVVSAEVRQDKVLQGTGTHVRVSLQNSSTHDITIWAPGLTLALVTDSPAAHKPPGYRSPDGTAYWEIQETCFGREEKPRYEYGSREVALGVSAHTWVRQGQNARLATQPYRGIARFVLSPGGKTTTEAVVGKELPPGQYELFFYAASYESSKAGPMSARIPFDVVGTRP